MMLMLQGPIPPHAPQGSPLAACMVVLLAVLLVGVVHLRNVLRRKRDVDAADMQEALKKYRKAAKKLVDALQPEDERRREELRRVVLKRIDDIRRELQTRSKNDA